MLECTVLLNTRKYLRSPFNFLPKIAAWKTKRKKIQQIRKLHGVRTFSFEWPPVVYLIRRLNKAESSISRDSKIGGYSHVSERTLLTTPRSFFETALNFIGQRNF